VTVTKSGKDTSEIQYRYKCEYDASQRENLNKTRWRAAKMVKPRRASDKGIN
jgi:hypothetical protein